MPDTTTATTVHASVEVDGSVDAVFAAFTEEMDQWWPPEHHLLQAELATMEVEPRVGGRIVDRGVDGSECSWARVLAWEPPHRFVFTWDISLQWQVETDPARCSEVEVCFTEIGAGRTRVDLTHGHIDRHGDGWEQMLSAVDSPEGWDKGLTRLAAHLAGRA